MPTHTGIARAARSRGQQTPAGRRTSNTVDTPGPDSPPVYLGPGASTSFNICLQRPPRRPPARLKGGQLPRSLRRAIVRLEQQRGEKEEQKRKTGTSCICLFGVSPCPSPLHNALTPCPATPTGSIYPSWSCLQASSCLRGGPSCPGPAAGRGQEARDAPALAPGQDRRGAGPLAPGAKGYAARGTGRWRDPVTWSPASWGRAPRGTGAAQLSTACMHAAKAGGIQEGRESCPRVPLLPRAPLHGVQPASLCLGQGTGPLGTWLCGLDLQTGAYRDPATMPGMPTRLISSALFSPEGNGSLLHLGALPNTYGMHRTGGRAPLARAEPLRARQDTVLHRGWGCTLSAHACARVGGTCSTRCREILARVRMTRVPRGVQTPRLDLQEKCRFPVGIQGAHTLPPCSDLAALFAAEKGVTTKSRRFPRRREPPERPLESNQSETPGLLLLQPATRQKCPKTVGNAPRGDERVQPSQLPTWRP